MGSIFTHEAGEITDEKYEQDQDAGNVDREYHVVQPIEIVGVLRRTT